MGRRQSSSQPPKAPPVWLLLPLLSGFLLALFGSYWDDAWHTERGRDSFFIAPHLAIYGGLILAGGGLGLWALLTWRRSGLRAVLRHRPLLLGLLGAGVTVAAAPVDNAWHAEFGRDAVIWSPPHMLGIVGSLALAAGITLELSRARDTLGRRAAWVAAAGILAAACFTVSEYDTDAPQFALLWYLPVIGGVSAFALSCVRSVLPDRWATTTTAAIYAVFRGAVTLLLAAGGFPGPGLALLVVPALALDLGARRAWHPLQTAGGFVLLLYAAYVPYLNWLSDGIELHGRDVLIGLPLTTAVVAAVLQVFRNGGRAAIGGRPATAGLVLLAALAFPAVAAAHDPGQGKQVGEAHLTATASGYTTTLSASPIDCDTFRALRLTARRAGTVLHAPLTGHRPCTFSGSVRLTQRGRWFVYAELVEGSRRLETWVPIVVEHGRAATVSRTRPIYLPPNRSASAMKLVTGIAIYALMSALLTAVAVMMRSARKRRLPDPLTARLGDAPRDRVRDLPTA